MKNRISYKFQGDANDAWSRDLGLRTTALEVWHITIFFRD